MDDNLIHVFCAKFNDWTVNLLGFLHTHTHLRSLILCTLCVHTGYRAVALRGARIKMEDTDQQKPVSAPSTSSTCRTSISHLILFKTNKQTNNMFFFYIERR